MKDKNKVIVRFAPSPTGFLHLGGARTALFNFFFARQKSGKLILRIEDTDRERSKPEYEKDIVDGLKWLNINFDETYRQSERLNDHTSAVEKLLKSGAAYVSEESGEGKRSEVIRFKNPNTKVAFDDLVKGRIEFDTTDLGDFVVAKSPTEPLFHLAVVVDDASSGITHVIRGEDHISNTPRQILIMNALGYKIPQYAHIPLILAKDRSKLSKRKHGEEVSLAHYIKHGYLPQTLVNYLALLGWNPGGDRETLALDEIISEFSFDRVQKGGAIFDSEKLNWLNKKYMDEVPKREVVSEIAGRLGPGPFSALGKDRLEILSSVLSERIKYLGEIDIISTSDELKYILSYEVPDPSKIPWKGESPDAAARHLSAASDIIGKLSANPAPEEVRSALMPYAEKNGKGSVLWPVRFVLSGREKSIDPISLISILGRDESLSRIGSALSALKK